MCENLLVQIWLCLLSLSILLLGACFILMNSLNPTNSDTIIYCIISGSGLLVLSMLAPCFYKPLNRLICNTPVNPIINIRRENYQENLNNLQPIVYNEHTIIFIDSDNNEKGSDVPELVATLIQNSEIQNPTIAVAKPLPLV